MAKIHVPSRFIAWLVVSVGVAVASLLVSATAVRITLIGVALLPLAALVARAVAKRTTSIALTILIGTLLLLLAGADVLAAWVVLSGQLLIIVLDLYIRGMLARLMERLPRPPALVRVERLNREELVPAATVQVGDRVLVASGEQIPVDGRLLDVAARVRARFSSEIDSYAPGEVLVSGSIAESRLKIEAVHTGSATTIAALAESARRLSAEVPLPLVRLERVLFGAQALWSVALTTWWFFAEDTVAIALFALGGVWWLGALLGRLLWIRLLLQRVRAGVLLTTWESVRRSRHLRVAVLDKTGTITAGAPSIVHTMVLPPLTREDILRVAAALESRSDHPIARTIRRAIAAEQISVPLAQKVSLQPSLGLTGLIEQEPFAIGNAKLLSSLGLTIPESIARKAKLQEAQGATVVYVANQQALLGALVLKDVPRPSAVSLVSRLKELGFSQIQLLSGDVPMVSRATAATIGVEPSGVFAHMTAERKKAHVQQLPRLETLAVGDPQADRDMLSVAGLAVAFMGWGPALKERTLHMLVRTRDLSQIAITISRLRMLERVWWLAPILSATSSAVAVGTLALLR